VLDLSSGDNVPVSVDYEDDRELAWSPDGQKLGILSYETNQRTLRIIEVATLTVQMELSGTIEQFDWSADGTGIFYRNREGDLYLRDLATSERTHLAKSVSHFSVSPNGRWLGLSIRNPELQDYFTFRVLDLTSGRLLTILDPDGDLGRLGSNGSFWSPLGNEVAVIFGYSAAQLSKVVIYRVYEDYLEVTATTVARETYQRDYDKDLFSVQFNDLTWSPDGQELLIIRSTSDAQSGTEVLLFDKSLTSYQRLPFGESVNRLVWGENNWVALVVASDTRRSPSSCIDYYFGAEIWLADMVPLKTRTLVTDTLSITRPAWRP